MFQGRARKLDKIDREREKGVVHLGNCSRFTATYKTTKQGKTGPKGEFTCIGSALVGHRIYLCGGNHGHYESSSLFVGDSNTYKWVKVDLQSQGKDRSPNDYSVTACFVHDDTLFVLSLRRQYKVILYALDLVVQEMWEMVFPEPFSNFTGTPYGAYHEQRGETFVSDGEKLYVFHAETKRVRVQETKGRKPGHRIDLACCFGPSTFFLFGGYPLTYTKLHALSLDTMSWAIVEFGSNYIPSTRFNFTMSYTNGRIFVMGGGPSSTRMERFDVFEVKQQRWKCVHSPETVETGDKLTLKLENADEFLGTHAHTAVITRDKLVILGGYGKRFQGLKPMELTPMRND